MSWIGTDPLKKLFVKEVYAITNEEIISLIFWWLEAPEFNVFRPLFKQEFEEISYTKNAALSIVEYICDHPFTPAAESIYKFELEMMEAIYFAPTERVKKIFRISVDTADTIRAMITEPTKS